jgi:hypothetical protein
MKRQAPRNKGAAKDRRRLKAATIKNSSEQIDEARKSKMSTQEPISHSDPLSQLGDDLERATETLQEVASNARETAKVASRKVRETARSGVYNTAYGASFGVVFSAVFLVELLPESSTLRRGLEDGAEAGFESAVAKAEARRAKRRRYVEKPAEASITGPTLGSAGSI